MKRRMMTSAEQSPQTAHQAPLLGSSSPNENHFERRAADSPAKSFRIQLRIPRRGPEVSFHNSHPGLLALLSPAAPNVLAHPWSLAGKCVLGAGGEQNREGTEPNGLARCHQRRLESVAVDGAASARGG